ncbi:hypothetical protein D9M71_713260 [compost metagenome]
MAVAEEMRRRLVDRHETQALPGEHPHRLGIGLEEQAVTHLALGQSGHGLAAVDGVAHATQQLLAVELALDQIVISALLDGRGIQSCITLTSQQNDRQADAGLTGLVNQLQARIRAQAIVDQI